MTKMTVNAVAIWNEKTEHWEVSVLSTYDNEYISKAKASEHTVDECDEYILPWAILQHNGMSTDYINEAMKAYEG